MKAFPKTREYNISDGSEGMDLRDYFAAKIAPIFDWEGAYAKEWEKETHDPITAKRIYQIADAMMKARNNDS